MILCCFDKIVTLSCVIVCVFAFCLIGCSDRSPSKEGVGLIPSNAISSFAVDHRTSNISSFLSCFEGFDQEEEELLFSLNTNLNEIQIFNISKSQLVKRIPFEMEGDRGVGQLSGFHVHRLDSIILFSKHRKTIFVTDTSGIRLEKVSFSVAEEYSSPLVSSTYFNSSPIFYDGLVLTKSMFEGSYSNVSNDELGTRALSYVIDLSTKHATLTPHLFPVTYWSDVKKHYEYSFTASPSLIVYSFYGDHDLYFSKIGASTKLKSIHANSKYFEDLFIAIPVEGTRKDRLNYFATSQHYGSIVYDKYRQVYYRFCYPNIIALHDSKLMTFIKYSHTFSVMILDENFSVLGETLFANHKKYVPNNFFIGREGLYVSINHPDNGTNEEEFMRFELLELK